MLLYSFTRDLLVVDNELRIFPLRYPLPNQGDSTIPFMLADVLLEIPFPYYASKLLFSSEGLAT